MKRYFIYGLISGLGILGCDRNERVVELSDLLNEECAVIARSYVPGHTEIIPTISIDSEGNPSLGIESKWVPDRYRVAFSGGEEHIFVIDGSGKKEKEIWGRFLEGEKAKVSFRKKYKSTYDCTKAEKELSKKEPIGYEFIDAESISK